jgi:hypothetical protein
MSYLTKEADQGEVSHQDRRPALWFAGTAVFAVLAGVVAGFWPLFSVPVGGGTTINFTTGVVIVFALAAAYCAYRLGQLWS